MAREFWYEKEINEMLKAISALKNKQDLDKLFDKILTPREINDMARRFKAIQMLEKGMSYSDIRQTLGLSPIIISRLANKVGYGFRRSARVTEKRITTKKKVPKKTIYYKGMPVIKIPR